LVLFSYYRNLFKSFLVKPPIEGTTPNEIQKEKKNQNKRSKKSHP